MQKLFLIFVMLFIHFNVFSQKCNREIVCLSDTIDVPVFIKKYNSQGVQDSLYTYKAITCNKVTKFGIRFDAGVSQYFYNEPTANWLSNHGGPLFGFSIAYENWNIGARFKPYTINPQKNLDFSSIILSTEAKLNPVKFDFYIGYSFDMKRNFSFEPYLGYSETKFVVINEEQLNNKFNIPSSFGSIIGITLNKYIPTKKKYEYYTFFANIGMGLVDYTRTHTSLGMGYIDLCIGVAFKGFFKREFERKIQTY